jgi:hypothetical protein
MENTEIKTVNVTKIKADIKELVEKQKFYKNQIKTVHLVGKRKIPAWEAVYKYQGNKHKLRILYAAYGLMRGKSFSVTENCYPEENHPLKYYEYEIDKLITKYESDVE